MHTAIHPHDRLAVHHTDAAARHGRAARRSASSERRSGTGVVAGTLVVLGLAVTGLAPAAALGTTDTYTGGDTVVHGLADGWYEPAIPSADVGGPTGSYR